MSALLHLLAHLDPARRRDCEAHDAADLESDMRHHKSSASRVFADLARTEQAMEASDEFELEDRTPGHPQRIAYVRAADSVEATMYGFAQFGTDAVFRVQPAQHAGAAS